MAEVLKVNPVYKSFNTGYSTMGYTDGKYQEYATEEEYREAMDDTFQNMLDNEVAKRKVGM